MVAKIVFTGNFSRLDRAMKSAQLRPIVHHYMGIATVRGGFVVQAAVRQAIKKIRPRNAALTHAIKGGSGPLIGRTPPTLFGAIAVKQVAWNEVFVGVLRTNKGYNLAETLHNGAAIPVTDAMRGLFFVLWAASVAEERGLAHPYPLHGRAAELFKQYKQWERLDATTNVIRIPKRPFMAKGFRDPRARKRVQAEWERGIKAVLAALKKQAGGG